MGLTAITLPTGGSDTGRQPHIQSGSTLLLDRRIALELVHATEAAAISAQRWISCGDKNADDAAAVDAMRAYLFHRRYRRTDRHRRRREGRCTDAV